MGGDECVPLCRYGKLINYCVADWKCYNFTEPGKFAINLRTEPFSFMIAIVAMGVGFKLGFCEK